uniref:NAD(P)/FAD-dependent oxidoreductase n=1 Tax=Sphingomonas bacterium TaxID=1895847 RepID=UPI0015777512
MTDLVDFIVIGGGVAGSAAAAELAGHGSVLLLEMEGQPGYHSSGRSAAIFALSYGNDTIRALTRASHDFFQAPPAASWPTNLLTPRPVLVTATHDQREALAFSLAQMVKGDSIEPKTVEEAVAMCPILRPEALVGAALIRTTSDIDVHQLQQGWLRLLKTRGGRVVTGAEVTGLDRADGQWTVATREGSFRAATIVNAAGAWADAIGAMAGALDIGLTPLRRTVCVLDAPGGADTWPMLLDAKEQFYLKPDAGTLLLSPADENPSEPCDAQADELDIAIAIDRVERATTLAVRRVAHRWAGLRSFVADRSPVVGRDPVVPGFVWYAALGGYGIQTAPALGRLAAA